MVSTGDDAQTPDGEPSGAGQVTERGTAKGDVTVTEPTRAQQTLARRVAESRATIPDFAVHADVDVTDCAAARAELRLAHGEDAPTFTHLFLKAAALALRDVPAVNASYRDNRFETYSRVNVGFTVAVDGGLVTPTILDADAKVIGAIAQEARLLAEQAREGTITARELSSATFTVANLGMLGVQGVEVPITAPQAAILGLGTIEPRLVVDPDGAYTPRKVVRATLTADARIVSGVDAARFLSRLRAHLEAPAELLA